MSEQSGGGTSRSTQPAQGTSAATDVSLREHLAQQLHDAQRRIDERDRYLREADAKFAEERDRRYSEISIEREKALKIKEEADKSALGLAREIQTYKDEKANELRAQIESERGSYATQSDLKGAIEKIEATMKPLIDYVYSQQGQKLGVDNFTKTLIAVTGLAITLAAIWLSRH